MEMERERERESPDDIIELSSSTTTTTTTWEMVSGCLDDVVKCESSFSEINDCDYNPKHTLILRRPSLDASFPCEITFLFQQHQDVKQIYVRSTAKIYEIYCSAKEKSDNEYLCTVRCSIAAREEEVQLETDGVGSISTCSNKSVDEVHSRTDSGSSTDGDGWVDVKSNKSPRVDTGYSSLLKKEDRFEATAEISDGDPVMSITLRLLSIQSGDYLYIDEVYVFADPVVLDDNHSSAPSMETSSGSAMLSMFMPTLMQLSKSRMSKVEEHSGSTAGERIVNRNTEQHSTVAAVTSSSVDKTEVSPSMLHNGAFVYQPNHLLQTQNSLNRPHITNGENDFPHSKIERTLDELVSRVSNIEAFFLRFEENMLKPISNMETRLERVEQKLESVMKNPQFTRTDCNRYSAPEFSCNESESGSICIGGNDCPATLKSESNKKDDCCPQELDIPTSDAYLQSSTSASQLRPGLIISAPEFSSFDEEEEINTVEKVKVSPQLFKKPVSIDDALASALAGFVTSVSTKPLEHIDTFDEAEIVCGAERSGSTSPSALSTALAKQLKCTEMVEDPENLPNIIEGTGNTTSTALVHSGEYKLSSVPTVTSDTSTSSKDAPITEKDNLGVVGGSEETTAVDGNNHPLFGGGSSDCNGFDSIVEIEDKDSIANMGCTGYDLDAGQALIMDSCDSPSGVDSAFMKEVESCSGEAVPNAYPAVLPDIIELPSPAAVDFSVPMLEVNFLSSENSSGTSSLESLLGSMLDLECEAPCVREVASSLNEQYDLVVIDAKESGDLETVNNKLSYVDDYDSVYMLSETVGSSDCNNQDMCASLI